MPTKRCVWGCCNSDSRCSNRVHIQGVQFFPLPKSWTDAETWRKWLHAGGKPNEQLNYEEKNVFCTEQSLFDKPYKDAEPRS